MKSLKVREVMTVHPFLIRPTQTVQEAAEKMRQVDCGVLPVGDSDEVIGMITDRDITLRVIAGRKDPARTVVEEVMTNKVYSCEEEDDVEEAAEAMREHKVARLLVTRNREVTGIISMADLLRGGGDRHKSDKVLSELLKPAHPEKKPKKLKMNTAGAGCESCED